MDITELSSIGLQNSPKKYSANNYNNSIALNLL